MLKISRMILPLMALLIISLGCAHQAMGHPHAFVEAFVTLVFDEKGFAGVKEKWILDEMVSFTVLDLIQEDMDGVLSEQEVQAIADQSFTVLREYDYFTGIIINDDRFDVNWATDFDAELIDGKLVYHFFVPCHVTATTQEKEIVVAVYDESFYTFIKYGEEGKPSIDPTQDPLFQNQGMNANPEDYERFSNSVGLEKYAGHIDIQGEIDKFDVVTTVAEEARLAYFYDQIHPEAFVVNFKLK